jgi:hypothetical protein
MKRIRMILAIALLAALPTVLDLSMAEADVRTGVGPSHGSCGGGVW